MTGLMRLTGCAALAVAMTTAASGVASADPNGGTVSGAVELPAISERQKHPARNRGFIRRVKGPLKEPRRADQRSQMIVVLMGGPVASDDAKPPKRAERYNLIGESFATDVFAYVAGSTVEIKNDGHLSPRLYAVGSEDAIESGPVNPRGVRPIKAPAEPLAAMVIRDRDSAHLSGTIVAMPHSYFSLIGDNGAFEIKGVPAGSWTFKIWYDGGWLEFQEPTVTVVANKAVKAPAIKLPVAFSSTKSGAAPTAEDEKLEDQ